MDQENKNQLPQQPATAPIKPVQPASSPAGVSPVAPKAETPKTNGQAIFNIANKTPGANANGQGILAKLLGKNISSFAKPSASAIQTTKAAPSISSLLGPKPADTYRAQEDAETKRKQLARTLFGVSVLLFAGVWVFFYTQLSNDFTWFAGQLGPNVASRFESSNSELMAKQTELNLVRFRMARLILDEVNNNIDPFQKQDAVLKSAFSTEAQKQAAKAEFQILGASLKKSLKEVQAILKNPLGIDTFSRKPVTPEERDALYESLLKDQLTREKAALAGADGSANPAEARLIDNVLRLVENKAFRDAITFQDFETVSEESFAAILSKIRNEGTDDMSSIERIRARRLNWSEVIQNIHAVISKADPLYGQGFFKTVGGFLFSSYSFDSKAGRISISGMTKTSDSKTFSAIAELVDSVEKSPKFKDIDFRSFTKSKDESGDYSSSVGLDFSLQTEKNDPRDEISQ